MESVRNTARKLKRHFKDVDEHFYGHSRMSSDEIFDVVYRHRTLKNPLKYYKGSSRNFEIENDNHKTRVAYPREWEYRKAHTIRRA